MKVLVIAEKYLAACDIAKVLGCTEKKNGYIEGPGHIVTWADGHLIGYQYPEEYNPEYKTWKLEDLPLKFNPEKNLKVLDGKEAQFEIVKKLIQGEETDQIINAGDAGREGYLLQHWIYKVAGNRKPVKVLWASSQTEIALSQAFANLRKEAEFEGILKEAKARSEIDYILGMNYSRLLTLKCSQNQNVTLPYGRCMTTLLSLIAAREKQIEEFQSTKSYVLELEYEGGVKGTIVDPEGTGIVFEDRKEAEAILKEMDKEGVLYEIREQMVKEKVPLLYSLSDMQSVAGRKYKYSPAETLKTLQILYEKYKIISYPRTDSNYLTSDMKTSVRKNLESCRFGKFKAALERCKIDKNSRPSLINFNDDNVTDHHALIPTENANIKNIYDQLNDQEKNIFDEIVFQFLGIFCEKRIKNFYSVDVFVNGYLFHSAESEEINMGYKELRGEKEKCCKSLYFQDMKPGTHIEIKEAQIKERVSSPPTRYNYGNIIEMMKNYHIGTPATMAATIEKLLDKEKPFLTVKNQKYYTTPFGRMYLSVIPDKLKDPELSEQIELKLSQVRRGELQKEDLIEDLLEELRENIRLDGYQKRSFQRCFIKKPSRENYKKKRRTCNNL